MTQEEKELLLKDLCTRLPYGVIMEAYPLEKPHKMTIKDLAICLIMAEPYKPYLRPMSSMTEEELKECNKLRLAGGMAINVADYIDWLNAHHFDYRGLIEKGLALKAPKGMYNLNNE